MNSKNSQTSDPRRLLHLSDKVGLNRSGKYNALSNLSIYYTSKNIKKSYKNNKFKKSTWNEKFELPDGSYSSVSDTQHYFKYIIKKHEALSDKLPIKTM